MMWSFGNIRTGQKKKMKEYSKPVYLQLSDEVQQLHENFYMEVSFTPVCIAPHLCVILDTI